MSIKEYNDTISLLNELRNRIVHTQKEASLAKHSIKFSHIEEVGDRIRKERKKQNLTLKELCELSGVAYVTLNKIEKGDTGISLKSLQNILHALGMKVWVG